MMMMMMLMMMTAKITKGRSPNKKTGKCGNFSQVGDPPPPPPCLGMTRLFEEKNHVFFCILGGVSHVKNSKKWKWDSGRPPPLFFSKFPHFPVFFLFVDDILVELTNTVSDNKIQITILIL